jgi:hypothetical protein
MFEFRPTVVFTALRPTERHSARGKNAPSKAGQSNSHREVNVALRANNSVSPSLGVRPLLVRKRPSRFEVHGPVIVRN